MSRRITQASLLQLWPQTCRCQEASETSFQCSLVQGLRPERVERTAVHGHARLLAHLGTPLLLWLGTHRAKYVIDSLSGI